MPFRRSPTTVRVRPANPPHFPRTCSGCLSIAARGCQHHVLFSCLVRPYAFVVPVPPSSHCLIKASGVLLSLHPRGSSRKSAWATHISNRKAPLKTTLRKTVFCRKRPLGFVSPWTLSWVGCLLVDAACDLGEYKVSFAQSMFRD